MAVELEQGQWGTVGSRDVGGRGREGWEDGVMWQVLDPSWVLGMTGKEGGGDGFLLVGGWREGVGLGLGHLGDAEVAGADLDAVYDPADLVVAELLEAKAV